MPKQRTSPTRRSTPAKQTPKHGFSLGPGGEECPHCEQDYAYEAEMRCARCDAPICSFCVSPSGKYALCPDCAGRKG